MLRRNIMLTVILVAVFSYSSWTVSAQPISCASFDSWVWAQSYMEGRSDAAGTLDPDGDGEACDTLRAIEGFSPAFWTDQIPATAYRAQLVQVTDGDTIDVVVNGFMESARLYRTDAPEYESHECGAHEATIALQELLRNSDTGDIVFLEHDQTVRDQYGRLLVYLWLSIDGRPYLANEALVRSGWASDKDYGDRLYASQMGDAAAFAKSNGVGAYRLCDPGFGPDSGALTPVAPQAPAEPLAVSSEQECESSYPGFCLPPAWVIGDQDCGDLPGWGIYDRNFVVHPPDSHGFDGNQDGAGCEGQR